MTFPQPRWNANVNRAGLFRARPVELWEVSGNPSDNRIQVVPFFKKIIFLQKFFFSICNLKTVGGLVDVPNAFPWQVALMRKLPWNQNTAYKRERILGLFL